MAAQPIADMLEPVGSVKVETAYAPDGAPVARVRVNLERAAKHRVRSARNTILVEVDRHAARDGRRRQRGADARAGQAGRADRSTSGAAAKPRATARRRRRRRGGEEGDAAALGSHRRRSKMATR